MAKTHRLTHTKSTGKTCNIKIASKIIFPIRINANNKQRNRIQEAKQTQRPHKILNWMLERKKNTSNTDGQCVGGGVYKLFKMPKKHIRKRNCLLRVKK